MKTIRGKIAVPMLVLVFLTAVVVLTVCILKFNTYINQNLWEELQSASDNLAEEVADSKRTASQAAQIIAADPHLLASLEANDRTALVEQALALQMNAGMDFCTILDPEGNVIARAHEPDNFGDSLANQKNVQSAISGNSATFVEKGSAVKLSVRSSVPIRDDTDKIIGLVSTGIRLDQDHFVDAMKKRTGTEVTVFLGDERISTTIIGEDGNRVIGTKALEHISESVLAGGTYKGTAMVVGNEARVIYTPLSESGHVIGMLFVGIYTEPTKQALWDFVISGTVIGIIALLLVTFISFIVSRRIVTPILSLVKAGNEIAIGNIDVDIDVHTKDEIKELADGFRCIVEANRAQAEIIKAISKGDLTVDVEPRSGKDVVNQALKDMIALNNEVFSRIKQSAESVAEGAKNISAGAETLSNASVTQAASIEELSAAILEVSTKSNENAQTAAEGAALGNEIMESADKGAVQMADMGIAVKEINEASRSIEGVIKTIDDIAFQTNLLALNASVEAARAGQHGKGFAVVADEVRNLASKSAQAANGTNELIENSINKAQKGSEIAEETAKSLEKIVEGVRKNSRIMSIIAEASHEQNRVTTHISENVNNVSHVVQQNSATAQESAASSAVMRSEAEELHALVSRFKLKNIQGYSAGMPSGIGREAGFQIID